MSILPEFYGCSITYLVTVGFLWGTTNPFLKKGSVGIDRVDGSNIIFKSVKEWVFLILNIKYMVPFLLNQCGSVLYVLSLQNSDLSLTVPLANTLTFLFTALTGTIMGEEKPNKITAIGLLLVLLGISLCVLDKV